ncbi:hypothetical protein Tsubulata_016978 [Turnera subulata]|uniref:Serine-threonine/tyrosine-protein kinase catalytic domain-containing protein n=1 Tax=Turnera subulata TaxID=218843 RepID=A0A9Q0IZ05_9ROSI|nr:hypothetical protein Tsubulata_016978 [Turnera subulata]
MDERKFEHWKCYGFLNGNDCRPKLELGKFDKRKMEILIGVALECVKLNKDERPAMSQVVELLLQHEKYPEYV